MYNVNSHLILWIIRFLTNRIQFVRFQQNFSSVQTTSVGSPQGTVLSPVLFTLYTNDCIGSETSPLIKYSDDSALVDLSDSDDVYFNEINKLTCWCEKNYLTLNVNKTKELLIDFRKKPSQVPALKINGDTVERVIQYKYLGTIVDRDLNFNANTDSLNKKCQSRIFCLQKLRSLNVNSKILQNFYRCFVESIITFSFICWFGKLSVNNRLTLNRIVNVSSKIIGGKQDSLSELYEKRVIKKAHSIRVSKNHVLSKYIEALPSGRRFRVPAYKTKRAQTSFIPSAVKFLNK